MAVLSMDALPLGFRFRPTDEELVNHYLRLKINGRDSEVQVIPEVDVCKWEPWDLPGLSVIKTDDPEWFFFCPRHRKYPNGHRSNRATDAGYWKATGKDRTIKSKKALIGMKRTLVFYSGRAPKGQRTNWIMHEYRPTSEDLDGTAPGQSSFVLCKLFNKEDERMNAFKYGEVDQIRYSTTMTKSSPDETSSELVQEIGTPDLKRQEQSDDVKPWLSDKCDDVSQNGQVMLDSSCNSHITSDVEDHAVEDNATEGFIPFEENSYYYDPAHNQICGKIFSPVHVHEDGPSYMDSLYAGDFGDEQFGKHFQDGTGEQDVSLSELLDEFINVQEESCEESVSQKNSVAGRSVYMSGDAWMPRTLPSENSYVKDSGTCSDTDIEVAQVQCHTVLGAPMWDKMEYLQIPAFGSGSAQAPQATHCAQEVKSGYNGDLGNYPFGQHTLPIESSTAFYGGIQNFNEPANLNNAVNNDNNCVGGTGIRIRSRQPHNRPTSANFATQGIAPRRIRLQMELSSGSFDDKKEVNAGTDEEEVQSALTKDEEHGILKTDKESHLPKFDKSKGMDGQSSITLRQRVKSENKKNSSEVSQVAIQPKAASLHCGLGTSFSLVLGIFIIMVLLVFFLGKLRLV